MLVHCGFAGQAGRRAGCSGAGQPAWHDDRLRGGRAVSDCLVGGSEKVNTEHSFHCAQEILANTFEPIAGAYDEFRFKIAPREGIQAQRATKHLFACLSDERSHRIFSLGRAPLALNGITWESTEFNVQDAQDRS